VRILQLLPAEGVVAGQLLKSIELSFLPDLCCCCGCFVIVIVVGSN